MLQLTPNGPIARIDTLECEIGGRKGACADVYFAEPRVLQQSPTSGPRNQQRVIAPTQASALFDVPPPTPKIRPAAEIPPAAKPDVTLAPPPPLRDLSVTQYQQFASLAAPERLTPPSAPVLAKLQAVEDPVKIGKPILRTEKPTVAIAEIDYAESARIILDKNISPAHCNNVEATLQNDAWALGAMVDLGFCAASRGDYVDANTIFERILEYTPDNYEALVGRALIAERAGDTKLARKLYQDALNALPPILESQKIVAAMGEL